MSKTNFNGTAISLSGDIVAVGSVAPDFKVVKGDLSEVSLSDFKGKRVVLNIFPSIDTGICAASVRKFNDIAGKKDNTVVICVSKDLPFAASRFCGAEGLENVVTVSDFRYNSFGENYGLLQIDGPLQGLLARAVIAIDENGVVTYSELVPEIKTEPSYNLPF